MDEARKTFWLTAFAALSQVWTWLEPTAARIRVWDGALTDIGVEDLERGVAHVLANHSGHQPPTPGEIRDAVQGELIRCAVARDVDGKVMRWEKRRVHPRETQPAPLGVLSNAKPPPIALPSSITRALEVQWTPR